MYWCYSGLIFGRCVVPVLAETTADCQVFHGFPHFVQTGSIHIIFASFRILPSSPFALTFNSMQCALPRAYQTTTIIIILQRYGPFSLALASLIIDAHSSLSNAFALHRLTTSFLKSSSTSSIHLSLGRPLPLLPSNFPSRSSLQTWSH